MQLIRRLTTLLRADAHGVVDALEDDSLVLRQHLRDAAAELERKRCRLEALDAEAQDLTKESERIARRAEGLDRDVSLALDRDQNDLARYAVKKLLPLRHAMEELGQRLTRLGEEREELQSLLVDQEAEYQQLEARAQGHLAELERRRQGGHRTSMLDLSVTDEDVELELLRRRQAAAGGA